MVKFLLCFNFSVCLFFADCGITVPSLNLDCSDRKNVRASFTDPDNCVQACKPIWYCTNGEEYYLEETEVQVHYVSQCVLLQHFFTEISFCNENGLRCSTLYHL